MLIGAVMLTVGGAFATAEQTPTRSCRSGSRR
jgi:hypothetical protein